MNAEDLTRIMASDPSGFAEECLTAARYTTDTQARHVLRCIGRAVQKQADDFAFDRYMLPEESVGAHRRRLHCILRSWCIAFADTFIPLMDVAHATRNASPRVTRFLVGLARFQKRGGHKRLAEQELAAAVSLPKLPDTMRRATARCQCPECTSVRRLAALIEHCQTAATEQDRENAMQRLRDGLSYSLRASLSHAAKLGGPAADPLVALSYAIAQYIRCCKDPD